MLGSVLVDKDFDALSRSFLIRSARHALPLAPLPEFRFAIDALEEFDANQCAENMVRLLDAYMKLKDREHLFVAYNQFGEYYKGLSHILKMVLEKSNDVSLTDTVRFCETAFLATPKNPGFVSSAAAAYHREADYQNNLLECLFDGVMLKSQLQ
jgi:hypothetical protein